MNNTFDIKRFGFLLQKDLGEYYFKFKSSMGAIFMTYAGVMLLVWVGCLVLDWSPMDISTRVTLIYVLTYATLICAPAVLYGHVNHKQKGIDYAMLPVSSLEKFLTMFIMTAILTPILCFVSLFTIDTFLSFLPLDSRAVTNIFTFDIKEISRLNEFRAVLPSTSVGFWLHEVMYELIGLSSVFLLGNMIFKSSKISKTILSITLFVVALITIALLVVVGLYKIGLFQQMHIEVVVLISWFESMSSITRILLGAVTYVITFIILFFTYRKIKNQQY